MINIFAGDVTAASGGQRGAADDHVPEPHGGGEHGGPGGRLLPPRQQPAGLHLEQKR